MLHSSFLEDGIAYLKAKGEVIVFDGMDAHTSISSLHMFFESYRLAKDPLRSLV